ncbi:MAG: hypothetical protein J6S40_01165 [Thermoguttaceae bacterium]|nr:hypothetical protein [Thermoguttaceae bacterium]
MRYSVLSVVIVQTVAAAFLYAANPALIPADRPMFFPEEGTAISTDPPSAAETSAERPAENLTEPSAERPAVPSDEKAGTPSSANPAPSSDGGGGVLNSDSFYQSFDRAFDEVLAETAPELRFDQTDPREKLEPVSDFLMTRQTADLREMFEEAIPPALACERLPGAKARRPFLFARRDDGEYRCLITGGVFDMTPGEILFTGRPFDAALGEDGGVFFILRREGTAETVYSRAGNFIANPGGSLYLEWNGQRYFLDSGAVAAPNEAYPLARFSNPEFLESDDGVLFRPTELSGVASPINPPHERRALITPRSLENSNARLDLLLSSLKQATGSPLAENRENQ